MVIEWSFSVAASLVVEGIKVVATRNDWESLRVAGLDGHPLLWVDDRFHVYGTKLGLPGSGAIKHITLLCMCHCLSRSRCICVCDTAGRLTSMVAG